MEAPQDAPQDVGIDQVFAWLRSSDVEDQREALFTLLDLCERSFGDDGRLLGAAFRDSGGIGLTLLCLVLGAEDLEMRQQALLIIGNLCSDSVDSESLLTKRLLLQPVAEQAILACLDPAGAGADGTTLLFACGALQNLCHDPLWSDALVRNGTDKRLQELVSHENGQIVRYAAGALKNMSVTLETPLDTGAVQAAVEQRALDAALEALAYKRATRKIATAFRRIPPMTRLQRLLAAKGVAPPVEHRSPLQQRQQQVEQRQQQEQEQQ